MSLSKISLQNGDDSPQHQRLVFPPLLSALDTYLESASDEKTFQVMNQVKNGKAKRRKQKAKSLVSKSVTISPPIDVLPPDGAVRPSSKKLDEFSSPRKIKLAPRFSEDDHEDFRFLKERSEFSVQKSPRKGGSPTAPATEGSITKTPRPPNDSRYKSNNSHYASSVEVRRILPAPCIHLTIIFQCSAPAVTVPSSSIWK